MSKLFIFLIGFGVLIVIGWFVLAFSSVKSNDSTQANQVTKGSQNLGSRNNAGDQTTAQDKTSPQIITAPIIPVGHLPMKGEDSAPVTIVEFGDFECPFCKRFFDTTFPQVEAKYISTGKVKYYFRHLPLSIHKYAQKLANASECSNAQGNFWGMHDLLYQEQNIGKYSDKTMIGYAQDLELNVNEFESCIDDKTFQSNVIEDLNAARQLGANGTPTFFINGVKISGAQPFSVFQQIIEQELQS